MAASEIGELKQAVIGKRLGQPAIAGKSPSPITVFLSVGNEGRIILKPVKGSLENCVPVLEDLVLGNRLPVHDARP